MHFSPFAVWDLGHRIGRKVPRASGRLTLIRVPHSVLREVEGAAVAADGSVLVPGAVLMSLADSVWVLEDSGTWRLKMVS